MRGPRLVAYVVNMFPKLSETFVLEELAELRRRGVEVHVLSLKSPSDAVQHPGVARSGLLARTWYDRGAFAEALRGRRPDLVHAHFATEPTRVAAELAAAWHLPYSFTVHGYDLYRKPPADLPVRAARAAAVVTVSEANAQYLHTRFGVPRAHVSVVPCGIDLEQFRPPDTPPLDPTIVVVARLRPVKNLSLLLRASALLVSRGVRHRVVVIGDGPSRSELEAERAALGLDEVVQFEGALDQDGVRGWWQRATLGALTSSSEGMPVSLMEAAACGVPVVAPAVGGVPELVAHGTTGYVFTPGDVEACADAFAAVLGDADRRARLSAAARTRARSRFGVEAQVDALVGIWDRVHLRAAS